MNSSVNIKNVETVIYKDGVNAVIKFPQFDYDIRLNCLEFICNILMSKRGLASPLAFDEHEGKTNLLIYDGAIAGFLKGYTVHYKFTDANYLDPAVTAQLSDFLKTFKGFNKFSNTKQVFRLPNHVKLYSREDDGVIYFEKRVDGLNVQAQFPALYLFTALLKSFDERAINDVNGYIVHGLTNVNKVYLPARIKSSFKKGVMYFRIEEFVTKSELSDTPKIKDVKHLVESKFKPIEFFMDFNKCMFDKTYFEKMFLNSCRNLDIKNAE